MFVTVERTHNFTLGFIIKLHFLLGEIERLGQMCRKNSAYRNKRPLSAEAKSVRSDLLGLEKHKDKKKTKITTMGKNQKGKLGTVAIRRQDMG